MRVLFFALALTGCSLTPAKQPVTVKKEEIRGVIQAHLRTFRSCYEKELTQSSSLQGKVVIDFDIDSAGSVARAVIKKETTTLMNANMQLCMLNTMKALKFPAAPEGEVVTVAYPFFFKN